MIWRVKCFWLDGGVDSATINLDKCYVLFKLTTGFIAFIISAFVSIYAMEIAPEVDTEGHLQEEELRINYLEDYSIHWHIELSIESQGMVTGTYQRIKSNCHEHWRSDCWHSLEINRAITENQVKKLARLIDAENLPFQVEELPLSPALTGWRVMLEVYLNNKNHRFASSAHSPSVMQPGIKKIRRMLLEMAQIDLKGESVFFDVQQ